MLSIRQRLCPATCGVMITLGKSHNLLVDGSGSSAATSRHAPPTVPILAPLPNPLPPPSFPRAMFARTAPGFHRAKALASIIPRVLSVSGTHRIKISTKGSRSSSRSAGHSSSTCGRLVDRKHVGRQNSGFEAPTAAPRPAGPTPTQADNANGRMVQIARRPPNVFLRSAGAERTPACCATSPSQARSCARPPDRPARPRRW